MPKLTDVQGIEELINQMWARVRQANLYAGRPRNVSSEESLGVAREALALAKDADDPLLHAEAWSMMAYTLNAHEQYVESIPYYRQAIEAFERAGAETRAARARLGFIAALSITGQSREALAVGHEASKVFGRLGDDASLAKLATNIGGVFRRLDDNERAVQYYFDAARLFEKIGDEGSLARTYLNLGNTLCSLDRFSESEEMYGNCENMSVRLGTDDLRGHALYNKAYLYFLMGRFSQALTVYRDVRRLFQKEDSPRHAALCDLDEAEIYVQLRLPHDALLLAKAATDAFSKLDMPYEQAKAIAFAGVALTQKRQFGDALSAFREAQAMLEQDGNAFWSALLDLYRAEVMFCIGRLWEAHSLASTADAKFTEFGDTAKRLVSLVLLGRVSMQLGRLDEAALHARTVRELAGQTRTSFFLFACHALSAEIAEREGSAATALQFYAQAAQEIELRHTHLHHDELGITFYKGKTEIFESLAHLTLDLEDPDAPVRAYTWTEKAKSQMFVDALAPHLPSVRSGANEALVTRVERLRRELNGSYRRFQPEFLTSPGSPRGEQIELKEDELVRTLSDLSKSDSEYVSLQSASSIRIEELQQSLQADTTVIEYFFARDEVLAFLIDRGSFKVVRHLTPVKRVQYLTGRLQYQLKKFASAAAHGRSNGAELQSATDQLMGQFYQELFATLVPDIHSRKLVIVPHGLLHRIPFHAFHDGENYVAERFDVSYAPSGSVLKYCLERPPVKAALPLVVSAQDGLNREGVLRGVESANFIHLEVPVTFRQDNPVLSGLQFSDGMICITDIYSTPWNSNLLSLKLTQPSTDIADNSDGMLGLVRSLLYAGCRSILMELWNVDQPTEHFSTAFYSEWLSGKSKLQAIRSVQEAIRTQHPHPFSWAPFVLIGQP